MGASPTTPTKTLRAQGQTAGRLLGVQEMRGARPRCPTISARSSLVEHRFDTAEKLGRNQPRRPFNNKGTLMKMYILVKRSVPLGYAIVAVAHASLATYLKFKDTDEMKQWLSGPFYKVVCAVSDDEFERAKDVPDSGIITESALAGAEVAIAFKPREVWPEYFKYLRLYRDRY